MQTAFHKKSLGQIKDEIKSINKNSSTKNQKNLENTVIMNLIQENRNRKFKSTLGDKLVQLETLDQLELN